MNRIVLVEETANGDWVGLFINGHLVHEDHEIDLDLFIRILKLEGLSSLIFDEFEIRPTTKAEQKIVDRTGRMPMSI